MLSYFSGEDFKHNNRISIRKPWLWNSFHTKQKRNLTLFDIISAVLSFNFKSFPKYMVSNSRWKCKRMCDRFRSFRAKRNMKYWMQMVKFYSSLPRFMWLFDVQINSFQICQLKYLVIWFVRKLYSFEHSARNFCRIGPPAEKN